MIFVTLGTNDNSFDRLLNKIDDLINKNIIKDKVIVQAGKTKYKSNNMEIFDLISTDKFDELINKCDLLITHGGVGSILSGIFNNKKVIAIPRLSLYKEHVNDHQLQIVKKYSELGYIIGVYDLNELDNVLKNINDFKPKKFKSNNTKFISMLEDYIDNL